MRFTILAGIVALASTAAATPIDADPTLAVREELKGGGGGKGGGKGKGGLKHGIPDVGANGKDCKPCQACVGSAFGDLGVYEHGNPNAEYAEAGAQIACKTITCKDCPGA